MNMLFFDDPPNPPKPPLPKAKLVWQLAETGPNDDPAGAKNILKNPSDVAFLDNEHFIVADSEGHRLPIYDLTGREVAVLCENQVWPNCLTVSRDRIILTDRKDKQIKIFDTEGRLIHCWGEKLLVGEDEIELRPHGVAVDSHGLIIVSDTLLNIVRIYDNSGKRIHEFGGAGNKLNEFHLPFYIATDYSDNIYVSDNMNYSVKIFDPDGAFQVKIGSGRDWGKRHFACPYGVTSDNAGHVFVVDNENSKVAAYTMNGDFLGQTAEKKDCQSPCGVALNELGDMVITENNIHYSNLKIFKVNYSSASKC